MTIPEILKELEPHTGRFPMEAMEAAIAQREAITPELLRVIETVAENPEQHARREGHRLHLFALYLLAQFREKRAYPLVVKMFSAPGETPFDLAGDTVTQGLNRVLGSVYDGDPAPLQGLVENGDANKYVRNAALNAFIVLAHSGQMPRDQVVEYFRSLFHGGLPRIYAHVWNGLVCAVAHLPAPELLEDVRQAYKDDLVNPVHADLATVERILRGREQGRWDEYTVITDAIAETEWWACFKRSGQRPRRPQVTPTRRAPLAVPAPPAPPAPSVAPATIQQPKIGRNDPCPCGSGKKYKKCCGKG
ncbi:MAG TPA: DUF1186 domain-containing protein [Dongiaceae bacterium]|nr:DUF1186 domain-containing protein [Dongiaceae bacterium]